MKKVRKKYRFTLEDTSRLREIKSFTLSVRAVVFGSLTLLLTAALIVCAFLVIISSGGIFRTADKDEIDAAELRKMADRVDSIQIMAAVNEQFLKNVFEVLDINRTPDDSAKAGVLLNQLPLDSLITSSPAERRFVATMGEREKYNLQVLSPTAADGMIFGNPVEGGIVAEESNNGFRLRMIVPLGTVVCSVADGIVMDTHPLRQAGKYSIIIQHSNGFVSRYSEVGTPLVEEGATVYVGQALTAPGRQSASGNIVGIELWHDGTPLYPVDYIYRLTR